MAETSTIVNIDGEYLTGRVKWFNNKAGFGFISALMEDNSSGADIFVHHSGICVPQYKYLVQGEYVEYILAPAENMAAHEFQAVNVRGIKGGKLMCETRREIALSRNYETTVPAPATSYKKQFVPRQPPSEWRDVAKKRPAVNVKKT